MIQPSCTTLSQLYAWPCGNNLITQTCYEGHRTVICFVGLSTCFVTFADPIQILDTNPPLLFHLHLLRLIELIRLDDVEAALDFATHELAPRGAQNPEFLADLERTMGLLAFPDLAKYADDAHPSMPADKDTLALFQEPSFAPIMNLMKKSQRIKVAKELNAAILESQGCGMDNKLSGLVRLMSWGEESMEMSGLGLPADERAKGRKWADDILSG